MKKKPLKLKVVIARPSGAKAADYAKLTGMVLTATNTPAFKRLKKDGLITVAIRPEREDTASLSRRILSALSRGD